MTTSFFSDQYHPVVSDGLSVWTSPRTRHAARTASSVSLDEPQTRRLRRMEYVPLESVLAELEHWLKAKGEADYITLSGSGEPTLHSAFGEVLKFIRSNSRIPAVLLTNGSMLHLPEVRSAACHADIVKVSLSAWDQGLL